MSIFDEFDANFDTAGLAKDAAEAAKNGNTRREVPHGTYEVEINKLELGKSKKGDPMQRDWAMAIDDAVSAKINYELEGVNGLSVELADEDSFCCKYWE